MVITLVTSFEGFENGQKFLGQVVKFAILLNFDVGEIGIAPLPPRSLPASRASLSTPAGIRLGGLPVASAHKG